MERFIKGTVVVIPFPFTDLSGSKNRPALVLADLEGEDILLCQITSQQTKDKHSIALNKNDFNIGSLPIDSYIRPTRIFTANKNIIIKKSGQVKANIFENVVNTIVNIIKK